MSIDRGAAALAERLNLTLPTKKGRLPWMSDTVADLLASGQFERAAATILGERGVFLPDGLPPFVEQMAAEIERVWEQRELAETEAARLADESDHLLDQLTLAKVEIERLRKIEAAARLVSEWHDSIGTGPIEELDAELGELHALTHPEAER